MLNWTLRNLTTFIAAIVLSIGFVLSQLEGGYFNCWLEII